MEEKQLMDFDVLTLGEGETADEDLQINICVEWNSVSADGREYSASGRKGFSDSASISGIFR